MFKRIVWATDGSSPADDALAYARELASAGAELVVVHIDEILPGARAAFAPVDPDQPEATVKVARQVEELRAAGLNVSEELTTRPAGSAAQGIAELADQVHADLIVVGSRGRTPLTGLLLGSVAHRLLHIAHQPVLVIPPATTDS